MSKGTESQDVVWQNGRVTGLGTLGGTSTVSEAINNRGQVVGWSYPKTGTNHAFLWQDGKMRDLGTLGGGFAESHAFVINDRGQVAGTSSWRLFVWEKGKMRGLPGTSSDPTDINNRGDIVGEDFVWQDGKMRDLGVNAGDYGSSINDRGEVVWTAWSGDPNDDPHVMLTRHGKARDLGEGEGRLYVGPLINERGQVIYRSRSGRALLWEAGKRTDLGTLPGGKQSEAMAINERGQIVGWSDTRSGGKHAVLWTYKP